MNKSEEIDKLEQTNKEEQKNKEEDPLVLDRILRAQNGENFFVPYSYALKEIEKGQKRDHWIWYVFPAWRKLRENTFHPEFLLNNMDEIKAYLTHNLLLERLKEITEVAVGHLKKGLYPAKLFGSITDAKKFHECMTVFAVAANELNNKILCEFFLVALDCFESAFTNQRYDQKSTIGKLEARSVKLLIVEGYSQLENIKTTADFRKLIEESNEQSN
eukprot:c19616_g1_i1.p1 GENE.c19616_g1_i1~~c19616_g1_i1.p1  ORF type:complete len:217 (-),score=67.11 c19616_g1_i1:214-864(-)